MTGERPYSTGGVYVQGWGRGSRPARRGGFLIRLLISALLLPITFHIHLTCVPGPSESPGCNLVFI